MFEIVIIVGQFGYTSANLWFSSQPKHFIILDVFGFKGFVVIKDSKIIAFLLCQPIFCTKWRIDVEMLNCCILRLFDQSCQFEFKFVFAVSDSPDGDVYYVVCWICHAVYKTRVYLNCTERGSVTY